MSDPVSNVVGIPGVAMAIPPGQPDDATVALLEKWLTDAKHGEIVGICLGGVKRNGATRTEWAGIASSDQMLAAATGLQTRVAIAWSCIADSGADEAGPKAS